MKSKYFPGTHKILYTFLVIILMQFCVNGFRYLCSSENSALVGTAAVCNFVIKKYHCSDHQSAEDTPNNKENFETENKIDDWHNPLDWNIVYNNYQIKNEHNINLQTIYNVAFHPEIIPPPPKTVIQNL